MVRKIGCGKKVQIGWNKILDCPITVQCGMSKEQGSIMLCEMCWNIKQGYYFIPEVTNENN